MIHNRGASHPSLPPNVKALLCPNHQQITDEAIGPPPIDTANIDEDNTLNNTHKRKPRHISEEEFLTTYHAQRYEIKNTATALGISRAAVYKWVESKPDLNKAGDLSAIRATLIPWLMNSKFQNLRSSGG